MENVKLTLAQKIEVANWIMSNNFNVALTGSILLHTLGIDLGREPQDIDIIVRKDSSCDFRDMLTIPPFAKEVHVETNEGYATLCRYMFLGTKIDFMLSEDNQDDDCFYDDIIMVKDILNAKKRYLLSDSNKISKEKHAKDIKVIEKWLSENHTTEL